LRKQFIPYKYDIFAGLASLTVLIEGQILARDDNPLLKLAGISLLALSVILWIVPVFSFKKHGNIRKGDNYLATRQVVNKGIYSFIRHPQYLAYMLFVSGFSFIYQNWIIYLTALLAITLFYIHSVKEEKEALQNFSQEYKDYCDQVPRFNIFKGIILLLTRKK